MPNTFISFPPWASTRVSVPGAVRISAAVKKETEIRGSTARVPVMAAPPDGQETERKDTIRLVAAAIRGHT